MVQRAASVAALVLIVASCTAASPSGGTARPVDATPTSESLESRPVSSSSAPSAIASHPTTPLATAVPSPTRTPRLDYVVTSFKLVRPRTGWVETDHGLLITRDDGATWVDVSPAGHAITYGLAALDDQVAYVATDEAGTSSPTVRLWRTSDGGRTWRWTNLLSVPLSGAATDCGCGGHDLLIDVVDPLVAFVDVIVHGTSDGTFHNIFRSIDGGTTWTSVPISIDATGSDPDLVIRFLAPDVGTVWFEERTYVADGRWGRWTKVDVNADGPVTFLDRDRWIMGRVTDPSLPILIGESDDAGGSWRTITRTLPPEIATLTFLDGTTWVAVTATSKAPAETWISDDAGITWNRVGKQPTTDPWLHDAIYDSIVQSSTFIDGSHAWVRTDAHGLATTSDGGAHWSVILR